MPPAEEPKEEHEGIAFMLTILEKVCAKIEAKEKVDQGHLERIVEFFKIFVDQCHHGKEKKCIRGDYFPQWSWRFSSPWG
jgi:hemerythrin-like domain-containing protein